jgi:hypothetical protein
MKRETPFLLQEQLQIFNLLRGNSNHVSSEAHKADEARSSQNGVPRILGLADMNKRVSGKQRNRYHLLPVTPCVMFRQQGEEDSEALMTELRGHLLFKSMPGFDRKPLRRIFYGLLRCGLSCLDKFYRCDAKATAY